MVEDPDQVDIPDTDDGSDSSIKYVPTSDIPPGTNEHGAGLKSLDNIAREVIAGHWGRGNVRRLRLEQAGYDPDAVQQEVTSIFNRS